MKIMLLIVKRHTVNPVYKGHSREPENVAFMSSCPLKLYALFINGKIENSLYRR
jgi:hypothetical protein